MGDIEFKPGCVSIGSAILCGPGGVNIRGYWECPDGCSENARYVVNYPNSAYYGPTWHCECGDTYAEGERYQRPFQRAWRKRAMTAFEAKWGAALPEGVRANYNWDDAWLESVTLPDGTEVTR